MSTAKTAAPQGVARSTVELKAIDLFRNVDVSPPGYRLRVAWAPAAGATSADLAAGRLEIARATTTATLGELAFSKGDRAVDVTIPSGKRVRALTLSGLKVPGGGELRSTADFSTPTEQLRLAVSTQVAGAWTPLCVVPNPGRRNLLPAQYTGASYSGGVLTLPDPQAPKLRLQIVHGDAPESFEPRDIELAKAVGTAAVRSADLTLTGPDGATLWAFPGELPEAEQEVDLRNPLQLALKAALGGGAAPDVTLTLLGAAGMLAGISLDTPHGALVRTVPGTTVVELQGDPASLPLGSPPLAAESPAGAVADVAVRYSGIRLHDAVRDAVPAVAGAIGGPIVGDAPVVRRLPPAAASAFRVAMASPVGRSPEGCQLSIELVDLTTGEPGNPIGPPGTVEVPAGTVLSAPWVKLPGGVRTDAPVGLSLRATAGRFLWAAGGEGGLSRLAVSDPDPGGRPVRIGSATLASVAETETTFPACVLPAAALRGPAAPALASDLFCTVELADITLRYAR